MSSDVCPTTPFEHDHAHHFNKVFDRIEKVDSFCPNRNIVSRSEQSAQEQENNQEEPGDEHGLLLGLGNRADQDAKPRMATR